VLGVILTSDVPGFSSGGPTPRPDIVRSSKEIGLEVGG
jgi:hypothetical protein